MCKDRVVRIFLGTLGGFSNISFMDLHDMPLTPVSACAHLKIIVRRITSMTHPNLAGLDMLPRSESCNNELMTCI